MNYKEINSALIPHLKRDILCRVEIERIACILYKGMVSKPMFNELTLKIRKLWKEWPIHEKCYKKYGFDKIPSSWFKEYYDFMGKKIKEVREKFRLEKCDDCGCLFEKEYICYTCEANEEFLFALENDYDDSDFEE